MFNAFSARITRAYVLLALAIVLSMAVVLSALSLMLFARGASESLAGATQRVSDAAARFQSAGVPLEMAAPQIVRAAGHTPFHVVVVNARGTPLAQNERDRPPSPSHAIFGAIGSAIGLPRARVTVPGGSILIFSDFDRVGEILLWYWEVAIPVAIVAMLVAWFVGRRITARAIGPLVDVTRALHVIAAGDFSPRPLREQNLELNDLTNAYNEVAHSLAAATAERERTTAQMRQFIADAGHELRTPLTVVMGYLDALRNGIVRDDSAQRTYDVMLEESRRMRTVIEKLIFLARLDRAPAPGALKTVDLVAAAERAAATVEPLANGRVTLERPAWSALVLGDETELVEAIKNLLDNALKYAPGSPVRVAFERTNGSTCVAVSDSGPGMDSAELEHAFDRFYRGSARADIEGSGLGLSIAKRTAERSGGTATIDSAPGSGTSVRLCLPPASLAAEPTGGAARS